MLEVEAIASEDEVLAYIVRQSEDPTETRFLTPSDLNLQVGFVVRRAGEEIARHDHRRLERNIVGTSEVLVVKRGRCELDIYDNERRFVAKTELAAGDIMIMVGGGHAFRMIEDTVFIEVKQGPYPGMDEKELF